MDIHEKLRERRKELNLTMLQVAQKTGVSEATISRWESGDIANMRRDKIISLANALQVHPSFIMGENEYDNLCASLNTNTKNTNYILLTPELCPETQTLLVFNKNGIAGGHEKVIPSDDVVNEINKLAKLLMPYPAEQINGLIKIVENGGNIPIKADMPENLKKLISEAANLSEENLKTLTQVAKSMK